MGLLDKLWDDVAAGPQPDKGLGRLRQKQSGVPLEVDTDLADRRRSGEFTAGENEARRITQSISIKKPSGVTGLDVSDSPVSSPAASSPMASPAAREKDNIWRSVFNPGQNRHMKKMGSSKFDNVSPSANSPTVYDWLYSGKHRNDYR